MVVPGIRNRSSPRRGPWRWPSRRRHDLPSGNGPPDDAGDEQAGPGRLLRCRRHPGPPHGLDACRPRPRGCERGHHDRRRAPHHGRDGGEGAAGRAGRERAAVLLSGRRVPALLDEHLRCRSGRTSLGRQLVRDRRTGVRALLLARAYGVYPDVVPALRQLRALGIRLGIISNWESWLGQLIAHHHLDRWFDWVIASGDAEVEKPNSRILTSPWSGRDSWSTRCSTWATARPPMLPALMAQGGARSCWSVGAKHAIRLARWRPSPA